MTYSMPQLIERLSTAEPEGFMSSYHWWKRGDPTPARSDYFESREWKYWSLEKRKKIAEDMEHAFIHGNTKA